VPIEVPVKMPNAHLPLRYGVGDLSCLGSNERNPLKAEAREGQVSGSERVIGPE
jgi:hypothetical protein